MQTLTRLLPELRLRRAQHAQLQGTLDNDDEEEDEQPNSDPEQNDNDDNDDNDDDSDGKAATTTAEAMDSNPDATPLIEPEVPETPASFFEAVAGTVTNISQVRKLAKVVEALTHAPCVQQLFLLLGVFDNSVLWKKSVLNARCRVCRKATNEEKMLLCDACEGQPLHACMDHMLY